jgi:hypothetical protein
MTVIEKKSEHLSMPDVAKHEEEKKKKNPKR